MKIIGKAFILLTVIALVLVSVVGCPPPPTTPIEIILNTGYDQVADTEIAYIAPDDDWKVIDFVGVTGSAPISQTPFYAIVVSEAVSSYRWGPPLTDSRWISTDSEAREDVRFGEVFTYAYEFTLPVGVQDASLDMTLLADQEAEVFLNGNLIGAVGYWAPPAPGPTTITTSSYFQSGFNTLTVVVKETYPQGIVTGLDVVGTVSYLGPEEPQGTPGSTRQIVVGEERPLVAGVELESNAVGQIIGAQLVYDGYSYHAIWKAYIGQPVVIKGSSFPPGDTVIITICAENRYWTEDKANECGAFNIGNPQEGEYLVIPAWVSLGTVSVKAWIDLNANGILEEEGEKQASWPLHIYQAVEPIIDLGVEKTVSDATPQEGDTINYTITLSNLSYDPVTGNGVPLTGVVVTDLLPDGVTLVSYQASWGTYDGITWNVGDIGPFIYLTLFITVTVDSGYAGDTITNTATLTAVDQTDTNSANDSASVDITVAGPIIDLGVEKTVSDATPQEGDTINYTITLSNLSYDPVTGNGVPLTGVVVTDLLPDGVTLVSYQASWGTYDGITWNVGDIGPFIYLTLFITVTVDSGYAGDTITNTATLTAVDQTDTNSANDSASADITVPGKRLSISLLPPEAANPVSTAAMQSTHTVTARVTYADGTPAAGITVTFSVTGVNPQPLTTVITNAAGEASFTYTGMNVGTDTITATEEATGLWATATKVWTQS